MSDPFKDSPHALLTDYRAIDARIDAEDKRKASLLSQAAECDARACALLDEQRRIVARLAPRFALLGAPIHYREGWADFAVSHDPECDFLTWVKLHNCGDLATKEVEAVLKAFNADDTGVYPPVAAALAVIDQEAS